MHLISASCLSVPAETTSPYFSFASASCPFKLLTWLRERRGKKLQNRRQMETGKRRNVKGVGGKVRKVRRGITKVIR
jgi:hypothetical protein